MPTKTSPGVLMLPLKSGLSENFFRFSGWFPEALYKQQFSAIMSSRCIKPIAYQLACLSQLEV